MTAVTRLAKVSEQKKPGYWGSLAPLSPKGEVGDRSLGPLAMTVGPIRNEETLRKKINGARKLRQGEKLSFF